MSKIATSVIPDQATLPVVASVGKMIPALIVFFLFFYLINFVTLAVLKYAFKTKITWPAMAGTVGVAASATFISLLAAFMITNNATLIFLITFVIMAVSNFLMMFSLLKLGRKESIILSVILSIIANPILWLMVIS